MSEYRQVVIETYRNAGEPTSARIRARPIPGQGLSTDMKVECSREMREKYPVGTKILIDAKITDREGGTPFLYAHYAATYEVISDSAAKGFIRERYGNAT